MKKRHGHWVRLHLRIIRLLLVVMALVCLANVTIAHATTAANEQEAARIALEQNGNVGKVLGVSTEIDSDGLTVFAVKILSNGRVRVIRISHSS